MLQQSLLAVSTSLTVSLLVSEFICARDNNDVKTRVTSATFLMAGLSTFTMSTFGVRCVYLYSLTVGETSNSLRNGAKLQSITFVAVCIIKKIQLTEP